MMRFDLKRTAFLFVSSVMMLGLGFMALSPAWAAPKPGYELVFADEFSAPHKADPDPSKWMHHYGGDGWGNDEIQYYSIRGDRANTYVDGKGRLHMVMRYEPHNSAQHDGRDYTSSRIVTDDYFEFQYGYVEARIKVPRGTGLWPEFWMLGADFPRQGGSWPECGEINILEHRGSHPTHIYTNVEGPQYRGLYHFGQVHELYSGEAFYEDFHTYALEWQPDRLIWYLDGHPIRSLTKAQMQRMGYRWEFDKPFYLLLNLAAGGDWAGHPNASTPFPAEMLVDYVRVYQKTDALHHHDSAHHHSISLR